MPMAAVPLASDSIASSSGANAPVRALNVSGRVDAGVLLHHGCSVGATLASSTHKFAVLSMDNEKNEVTLGYRDGQPFIVSFIEILEYKAVPKVPQDNTSTMLRHHSHQQLQLTTTTTTLITIIGSTTTLLALSIKDY